MDISNANTEPFISFHRTRESLDRTIKVTTAALREIQRASDGNDGTLIQRLVSEAGEPWGAIFRLRSSTATIDDTIRHLSGLWIAHVYSMFNLFLDEVFAEVARWSSASGKRFLSSARTDDTGDISLDAVFMTLNGNKDSVVGIVPLFRYFEIIRNCVVHRVGLASSGLATMSASKLVLERALDMLPQKSRSQRRRPELPQVTERHPIALLPRHSILASEVTYRIAKVINSDLLRTLDVSGVVYMAAHHSILRADHQIYEALPKRPEFAINTLLSNRYRVKLGRPHRHECIKILKDLGHWLRIQESFKKRIGK